MGDRWENRWVTAEASAEFPSLAEAARRMRRLQRRRLRRLGPTKPALDLPELELVNPPILLPGQTGVPKVGPDDPYPGMAYYRPDGTPITGPFEARASEAEGLLRSDRHVAKTTMYRAGTRLWISTVFLGLDHSYGGRAAAAVGDDGVPRRQRPEPGRRAGVLAVRVAGGGAGRAPAGGGDAAGGAAVAADGLGEAVAASGWSAAFGSDLMARPVEGDRP